ncbi:MAG: hypothetical protein NTX97_07520 [Bacteroidetes bacterium]|nr:hypothetical protein [Bacteroidota bacterium]
MENRIVIVGAGGHGKVVCDAILAQQKYVVVGFVDDSVSIGTTVNNNYKVIANKKNMDSLIDLANYFVIAIGNNKIREQLFIDTKTKLKAATIIHPTAVLGSDVKIGEGAVILANSVISANSLIGENTIVNAGVIVDHDCVISNSVHLSIGTIVGSNSIIGNGYTTAIGENINSFSKIG